MCIRDRNTDEKSMMEAVIGPPHSGRDVHNLISKREPSPRSPVGVHQLDLLDSTTRMINNYDDPFSEDEDNDHAPKGGAKKTRKKTKSSKLRKTIKKQRVKKIKRKSIRRRKPIKQRVHSKNRKVKRKIKNKTRKYKKPNKQKRSRKPKYKP